MFSKKSFISMLTVAAVSLSLAAVTAQEKGRVVIKGSTTVLPVTMKAIEAFKVKNPQVSITVEGSGSSNGIKALMGNNCDIANSSREMKKEELAQAKTSGQKIKEIAVALDMIVPVVHPSNKVKNLTKEQLKGIYDGTITNWNQVGGDDMNIVVISRDSSSGTFECWHELVMKKTDVRKDALMQASNGAIVSTIAQNKKAIGYIGFGYMDSAVKGLNVEGVVPTIKNGKSGKYPVSRKLYMYVNEKNYSSEAKSFVNFLLSKEGQKLVVDAGYIAIK